jgi:hypothetical protein
MLFPYPHHNLWPRIHEPELYRTREAESNPVVTVQVFSLLAHLAARRREHEQGRKNLEPACRSAAERLQFTVTIASKNGTSMGAEPCKPFETARAFWYNPAK